MKERTFVITGGNSGLGYQCAKNIAIENDGNHVIIACRNVEKSKQSAATLLVETGNPHLYVLPLDLASPASVREFCRTLAGMDLPPLYGLVCNAIAGSSAMKYTADGIEQTFGVGHLGHFLLANILSTTMCDGGRIVFVSSDQHNPPKILGKLIYTDALDLAHPPQPVSHAMRYSATKLCNLYCTYQMAERIKSETDKRITVNAFNPGFMADTGLSGNAKGFAERLAKNVAPLLARLLGTHSNAEKSGQLLASLMTGAQWEDVTGKYFDRNRERPSSELSRNRANSENLWKRSIELVALQQHETIYKFK
ncbi:MAG: SDR family NAD(P)-dependent oxidoreductase [Tannerella sp.]|jgi:NAD(P)-dependent dehydrogenase (short-subunit alcohol dehydrogenase family)|nr:SDR family NAD(P)-dependent oxidoreductase [Tannerella sp.]